MAQRIFLVDVEATSRTPRTGVMTEFGVVDYRTRAWFHGHVYDFHPHPDIPALPIADRKNPGFTATLPQGQVGPFDGSRHDCHPLQDSRAHRLYAMFTEWLNAIGDHDRPVFVSDNPGFDFMWMADAFDEHEMANPFGYSSRRIGDLAAGLSRNWRNTNSWKRHRKTGHDHNPVNDALGNAEALHHLLTKHHQAGA